MKEVALALKISIRLSAGGGLSSQAVFQKMFKPRMCCCDSLWKMVPHLNAPYCLEIFYLSAHEPSLFRANLHLLYGADVSVTLIRCS